MNAEIFLGKWTELKGEVKRRWGKLTDDDVAEIDGVQEMLIGKLQEHYGYARDEAEREYLAFLGTLDEEGDQEKEDIKKSWCRDRDA